VFLRRPVNTPRRLETYVCYYCYCCYYCAIATKLGIEFKFVEV